MSEVLFGQSYFLRFDQKLWDAMQPYPPLGTLYAASYLRDKGYDVALFDAMLAKSEQEWEQALEREQPRFAVLYEDNFNYLSKMCLLRMREAAYTMIEMARAHGCRVIVCGADASDHAAEYLSSGADYILVGEGEHTLGELMDCLTHKTEVSLESIMGIVYRHSDNDLMCTLRRPDIKMLDSLPFPAWDLVDIPRYRDVWRRHHGYYSMNMVTTRGCPFHCNWCAKPIWGQRYNVRSPENVVDEMKWISDRYQPDHIWFVDDIMGLKPGWLQRFADLVEEHDVRIPFKSLNRVDLLLRGDTVQALKRAGAQTIWVGAESGSQKILDAMEKGTKVEQIYEAARRLREAGIDVGFFLQFGYPSETRDDIEKTFQMVRDCRPDDIGASVSYPLPGTKFYETVRDQLGVKQNWLDSNDLAMLYRGPFTTEYYRQLHTVLHREFRARNYRDALKAVVRRPGTVRRKHLRHLAAMTVHTASLPVERYRLNRLARRPHTGFTHLPDAVDPAAAAMPTPQSES